MKSIEFGFTASNLKPLAEEVAFAKNNGFSFLQIWLEESGLSLGEASEQKKITALEKADFPLVLHLLVDVNMSERDLIPYIAIYRKRSWDGIIIHPLVTDRVSLVGGMDRLYKLVCYFLAVCRADKTPVYIENNSKLDPIFQTAEEVAWLFEKFTSELGFLLDVAHMDDYGHLKKLVDIKYPDILHIADKNLEAIHEHLTIGEGAIDFKFIFTELLPEFCGKLVFEVPFDDKARLISKKHMEAILML